jgi:hypothetical protein
MLVMKQLTELRIWTNLLNKRPKRRNMEMRLGTWNVRSFCRVGSLMTVSRELSRYRLKLVGVQEVRWEGSGSAPTEYTFFYWKINPTFRKTYRLHLQDDMAPQWFYGVLSPWRWWCYFSQTSDLTIATRCNTTEDICLSYLVECYLWYSAL